MYCYKWCLQQARSQGGIWDLGDKSISRQKILQFPRVFEEKKFKKFSGLNFFIQKISKSLPRKISGYAPGLQGAIWTNKQ